MRFITPIIFIEDNIKGNDLGDTVITQHERKAIGNKVSIGSKEFYEAHALGLKPEIKIEVRTIEYNGERKIKLDNKIYVVIKTYDRQDGITELTLTCQTNNATKTRNGITKLEGNKMPDGKY